MIVNSEKAIITYVRKKVEKEKRKLREEFKKKLKEALNKLKIEEESEIKRAIALAKELRRRKILESELKDKINFLKEIESEKEEIVKEIENLVIEKMRKLKKDDYKKFLKKYLSKGLKALNLSLENCEIIVGKKDKEIAKELKIPFSIGDFDHGIIIKSKDHKKVADYRLKTLIREKITEIEKEIMRSLSE